MDVSVIVLAAGHGTRMNSRLPKVLQPLAGKPILHHILDVVATLELQQTIVVAGANMEQIAAQTTGYDVDWALQSQQLGTGHAVQCALPLLAENIDQVLILCGDVPCIEADDLLQLLQLASANSIGILTAKMQDPAGLGRVLRDADEKIIDIIEHKDATSAQLAIREINAGIYLIPKQILTKYLPLLKAENSQHEYYLPDIIRLASKEKIKICSFKVVNSWQVLGVNTKQELSKVERFYQQQQAEQLMDRGVTLADPTRLDVRGEVQTNSDVFIDINVILEGQVILGNNVKIGPHVIIKDSILHDNVVVLANSIIDSAIIGEHCQIGPFARVRPGTKLGKKVKIGNFVEIKQSRIGAQSKINHLSYVGDAEVGSEVNIGAGTITCNYDGLNKHKTIIEDQVFIGSNSELVAPITIGKGATIAAGTTLIKDAPPEMLTCTQKKQIVKEQWVKPSS